MTQSDFVLRSALGKKIVTADGLADVLKEQKSIGRNLNQIAVLGNMGRLNAVSVVEEAVRLGKKYLIATIHPDNIPIRKFFEKLGMQKTLTYTKSCGYIRDIYLMEL